MRILAKSVALLAILSGLAVCSMLLVGRALPEAEVDALADDRTGASEIYLVDVARRVRKRLTFNSVPDDSPVWSPDGTQLAFASYRTGDQEIYVMDADGANARNLSRHPAADYAPVWSPDGTQLAFTSWRDENFEIYVVGSDGRNLRSVSHHPADDQSPIWSRDGHFIIFESRRDGSYSNSYMVDLQAHTLRAVPYNFDRAQGILFGDNIFLQ